MKVVRRGRPPKCLKKSIDSSPSDRIASEFSSDATLANGGDNASWATAHNLRKGPTTSVRFRPADSVNRASHGSYVHGSHAGETYTSWLTEWENEFPGLIFHFYCWYPYFLKHFSVSTFVIWDINIFFLDL